MEQNSDITQMRKAIADLKQAAEQIRQKGDGFPCVFSNVRRIEASIKMLEINLPDGLD
jgi:hypothetical protein